MDDWQSQAEKFKQAARELQTDDDPQRFKDKLRRIVKRKLAVRLRETTFDLVL